MKLDAKFIGKENKVFTVDGTEISLASEKIQAEKCRIGSLEIGDSSKIHVIQLPWSLVGFDEDSYNEEFLAAFRDWLKELEEKKIFCMVEPVADKEVNSEDDREAFTASMKHSARRIKDCESIVGYAVPSCVDANSYMEEIGKKHKHYIFFSADKSLLQTKTEIAEYC